MDPEFLNTDGEHEHDTTVSSVSITQDGEIDLALIEDWIASGAMNSTGKEAVVPAGARVRLEGTLRETWLLDDLPLDVTSQTRIDKNPRPGDRIRVRGTVRTDGSLEIDRIQRR